MYVCMYVSIYLYIYINIYIIYIYIYIYVRKFCATFAEGGCWVRCKALWARSLRNLTLYRS